MDTFYFLILFVDPEKHNRLLLETKIIKVLANELSNIISEEEGSIEKESDLAIFEEDDWVHNNYNNIKCLLSKFLYRKTMKMS